MRSIEDLRRQALDELERGLLALRDLIVGDDSTYSTKEDPVSETPSEQPVAPAATDELAAAQARIAALEGELAAAQQAAASAPAAPADTPSPGQHDIAPPPAVGAPEADAASAQ